MQSPLKTKEKDNEPKTPKKKETKLQSPLKTTTDTKKEEKDGKRNQLNKKSQDEKLPESDVDMFDCHTQQTQQETFLHQPITVFNCTLNKFYVDIQFKCSNIYQTILNSRIIHTC